MIRRSLTLFAGLFVLILVIGWVLGMPFTSSRLVEAAAYALIAMGLNIQWGYGGLFNFGIMGFLMVGGAAVTFISYPANPEFWHSDGPMMLGRALLAFAVGAAIVIAVRRADRIGITGRWKGVLTVLAWFVAYVLYRSQIDPAAAYIESTSGWVGGLGGHPVLGWLFGGVLAAGIAYVIGKICLGLRTDYLAIATIGISEIVRALIKNMDWLTRGTLTVSPIPWPTPLPQDLQAGGMGMDQALLLSRGGFLLLAIVVLAIVMWLINRAYGGPWGRMMRAIRDNHVAAASMGKNVTARQLEIFVFGSVLMGIGGAMLVSFVQIFDPSSYQPINHTFLIWVMIIVGGAGNNWGALFGAVLIWLIWVISEPLARAIFETVSLWSTQIGWGAIPDIDVRSAQMRVFVLGLVITIALRFAPKGLIPEVVRREG
ncbi:branched-chain amino acid ABC transporter permease [Devosia sp. PTR5]|uniref:Branched-chain amino acid ABC transporter permease n=1 Tax=Devosia oryzisoli TaxID=2774138 RepID=A0A927FVJ2_9HYPH|nr:branched-chain amino acid ABC transporter permease [Devosia oryzisoli]MBD8067105.1 branched-chain amino acid ABC transporter permease [Devosia oryzisoli]